MDCRTQLGIQTNIAVIIEVLGDQFTNMARPFWPIPLLAIATIRARDIIGYTTVAMIVGDVIVGASLTVFLNLA
jgi:short-chain fatty acids transporter